MTRLKPALFLLIGLGVALIMGILVLELIFGTWFSNDPWRELDRINLQRDVRLNIDAHALYGDALATVTYTRDRYGLRGPCADPASIEILSIGGSTTDQLFVPDGQTFQDVLQGLLERKLGRQVCIANAGIDGHSTFAHIEALERWFPLIPGLKPRIFLLYIGINDAGIRLTPQVDFDLNRKIVESPVIYALSHHSALYGLGRTIKHIFEGNKGNAFAWHNNNPPKPDEYTATRAAPDIDELVAQNTAAFSQRLTSIVTTIKTRYDAIPVCVSQPNLFTVKRDGQERGLEKTFTYDGRTFNGLDYQRSIRSIDAAMQKICTGAGGYYFDMASATYPEGSFYDAVHMGPVGARALGSNLFEAMTSQGVITQLGDARQSPSPSRSGQPR